MSSLDLAFGQYAVFIWTAFGVTALVLGALVAEALLRARRWKSTLARLEREAAER